MVTSPRIWWIVVKNPAPDIRIWPAIGDLEIADDRIPVCRGPKAKATAKSRRLA